MERQSIRIFLLKVAALMGGAGLVFWMVKDIHPFKDPPLLGLLIVLGGVLYGLMAGIGVYMAWMQFSTVQVAASKEAHLIGELYDLTKTLSNRVEAQGLAAGFQRYIERVLLDEWRSLAKGQGEQATQSVFLELTDRLMALQAADDRDTRTIQSIQERVSDWGYLREKRISWGLTRMPLSLGYFLLFLASVMELLLLFYPSNDVLTQLVAVVFAAGVLGWCQWMIHDLDNPFAGISCLSSSAFQELQQRLKFQREQHRESLAIEEGEA